jgi:hypothetical protein
LARVNGGHGLIPMPHGGDDSYYPTVTRLEVALANLVAGPEGGYTDSQQGVLERAGFRVERGWD